MRRVIFPSAFTPETQNGDDSLPFVRGWPDGTISNYDPSSPGSTFSDWTLNAGLRVGTGIFCWSKDFNYAQAASGTKGVTFLWKPPAGRTLVVLGWSLEISSIVISGFTGARNNITLGITTLTNVLGIGTSLHQRVIPSGDAGWSTGGGNSTWIGGLGGGGGVSNFSSGGGDAYGSDTIATGNYNSALYVGRMSMFKSSWREGASFYDRFGFYVSHNETGSPTATYIGTAHMIGFLMP